MSNHAKAIEVIGGAAAVVAAAGVAPIVIAVPVAAPGILGAIGLARMAIVIVPVAGVVAVGGLLAYGAKEVLK
jgi:hypothetical protein